MTCPDDLVKKIQDAPIIPKPTVEELLFTWDWRSYITPKLTDKTIANHSFYHSFILRKENGVVVLRAKQYTQSKEWGRGIRVLKEGFECSTPVPVSEFRLETLNIDKVFSDLYTKYFPTLTVNDRQLAEASWEKLRSVLENLPRKINNLQPLRLGSLPRQAPLAPRQVPSYLQLVEDRDVPEMVGEFVEDDISEPAVGQFDIEIKPGMDVAIFTHTLKNRPWLGRVLTVEEDCSSFQLQWFKKKGRSMIYEAQLNKDGTKYTSSLPLETVMLWEFSTAKSEDEFEVSKEWFEKIMAEYASHDQCYD